MKATSSLLLVVSVFLFSSCGDNSTAAAVARPLSGTITYDFVPVCAANALDYANTIQKPVCGARICAIGAASVC